MKTLADRIWKGVRQFADRYPVVIAAVVIIFYYVLTNFNLYQHKGERHSFLDYVMEFDSLFFLWLATAAFIQVQKWRKSYAVEEEQRRSIERVLDRQQIYSHLVNDITMLLQDSVNNPLAVISVTTQEMRRKFSMDNEILRWLDRIDGAMQRIHHTIRDIQAYESQKLIQSSHEILSGQHHTSS